jgi:hypothetical protein
MSTGQQTEFICILAIEQSSYVCLLAIEQSSYILSHPPLTCMEKLVMDITLMSVMVTGSRFPILRQKMALSDV